MKKLAPSIRKAVKSMVWLEPSDQAAVDLCLTYAETIDFAVDEHRSGDITQTELNKALYLGPHILSTLKAIGGTPAERKLIMSDAPRPQSSVDELKKKRQQKRAVGE